MIALKDRITIRSSPEAVTGWLEALPQHYLAWHPDHIACRFLKGSMWQVGSVLEAQEYLHGKPHTLRFVVTEAIPGQRMAYKIPFLGWGAFNIRQQGESVMFEAELHVGSPLPLIGPVVDFVLTRFFGRRIDATRFHMREEGINLKEILESQSVSAPVAQQPGNE